jgi:hypothetical protein
MANAAWLAFTVMAHNLGRAVALLAEHDLHRATAATLRRTVFTMPGRLVRSGRRHRLRLPADWPWAGAISTALHPTPAPTTRTPEKPADRQPAHARTTPDRAHPLGQPAPDHRTGPAVDPGLISRQWRALLDREPRSGMRTRFAATEAGVATDTCWGRLRR